MDGDPRKTLQRRLERWALPIASASLCIAVCACVGWYASYRFWMDDRRADFAENLTGQQRLDPSKSLTNPLLDCSMADDFRPPDYDVMREQVSDLIQEKKGTGTVLHASVYFRTLNSGYGNGLYSDTKYDAASLMKVPYLFIAYKMNEAKPGFLDTVVKDDLTPAEVLDQNIPPRQSIEAGHAYTIRQLVHDMIVYSDNAATSLLTKHLDPQILVGIFKDLDINREISPVGQALLTPKEYSAFFRVLYNASYFSRKESQEILDLLTQTEFAEGLVAGVPKGTVVAHKFGEREYADGSGNVQLAELHECGIVYYPKDPYFICVMTQGAKLEPLKDVIKQISDIVYQTELKH